MNLIESKSDIESDVAAPKENGANTLPTEEPLSKRKFIKKSVIAYLSIISTAEVARRVALKAAMHEVESASSNNIANGETVLKNRKYVVMTDREKQMALSSIIDNYKRVGR